MKSIFDYPDIDQFSRSFFLPNVSRCFRAFTYTFTAFSTALALLPLKVEAQFPATLDLGSLDGTNGFVINEIASFDNFSVFDFANEAGDINGDGIDDLIIGANGADPGGNTNAGEAYVVFGQSDGFSASFDLDTLDGNNGFVIRGMDPGDELGISVRGVGDVNGDDIDDIAIGAPGTLQSYVVFGSDTGFPNELDLDTLNGSNGFALNAVGFDPIGLIVNSAGDVNGDGIDDFLIGGVDMNPALSNDESVTYVIFGRETWPSGSFNLSSLDGNNGFAISGFDDFSLTGNEARGTGDINGDGIGDLLIQASGLDESYIVFGRNDGFPASIPVSSLDGNNGFVVSVPAGSVSVAGDVNGDGVNDFIIGEGEFTASGSPGNSFVVFGSSSGFSQAPDLSMLDGTNGFTLNGIDSGDFSGFSVSGSGDVNDDGIADLIVGAPGAGVGQAGESYVVFGRNDGFQASVNLSQLDGTTGFRLDGTTPGESSGLLVRGAGDINGDGVDDFLIGGVADNENLEFRTYVVFGQRSVILGDVNLDGVVNFSDIAPFIELLTFGMFQAEADIDGSGVVDFADISPFIGLLTN